MFANVLSFTSKPTIFQKAILLAVPDSVGLDFTFASSEIKFHFSKDEVKCLRKPPSRNKEINNWILLMEHSLLKSIISDGRLYIGLKRLLL